LKASPIKTLVWLFNVKHFSYRPIRLSAWEKTNASKIVSLDGSTWASDYRLEKIPESLRLLRRDFLELCSQSTQRPAPQVQWSEFTRSAYSQGELIGVEAAPFSTKLSYRNLRLIDFHWNHSTQFVLAVEQKIALGLPAGKVLFGRLQKSQVGSRVFFVILAKTEPTKRMK
jgi:hypothetical protein